MPPSGRPGRKIEDDGEAYTQIVALLAEEEGDLRWPCIWVFVEEANGAPSTIGLELLTKARELGDVTAIYLGTGSDEAFAALGAHGAACSAPRRRR